MSDEMFVKVSMWIIGAFVLVFIFALMRLKAEERKLWNRGRCFVCRSPWVKFSHCKDSGRGYYCEKCQRHIWISFSGIEKQK